MSNQPTKATVAIFGATGLTGSHVLTLALKAGFYIHALARNPSKLIDMLLVNDISEAKIQKQLQITEGDIRDVSAVKKVLLVQGQPAKKIVSCMGMSDSDLFSLTKTPGQTICEDAARTIVQALEEMESQARPHFIGLSSSGATTDGSRDYPLLFWILYNLVLIRALKDKIRMDQVISEAESEGKVLGSYTLVKPSVLTNGASLGLSKIRAGTEKQPAIGYTISRKGVALWIFEKSHTTGRIGMAK